MQRQWIDLQNISSKHEVSEEEFLTLELPNSETRKKCDLFIANEMKKITHTMTILSVLGMILSLSFTIILVEEPLLHKLICLGFIVSGIALTYIGIKTAIPANKILKQLKNNTLKYFVMDCKVYKTALAKLSTDKPDTAVVKLCKNNIYLDKEFIIDLKLYDKIKDSKDLKVTLIKLDLNYYIC